MTQYLSVTEYARAWNVPRPTVKRWCARGQLAGAFKVGRQYAIPAGAPLPVLPRGRPPKPAENAADRDAVARLPLPAPEAVATCPICGSDDRDEDHCYHCAELAQAQPDEAAD
jgi:excisionase family DNA binding protein